MSVRKVVTLTTSAKDAPAAASARPMFANTCRACATTSPIPTTLPSASSDTQPGDEEQIARPHRVRVVRERLGQPLDPVLLPRAHFATYAFSAPTAPLKTSVA